MGLMKRRSQDTEEVINSYMHWETQVDKDWKLSTWSDKKGDISWFTQSRLSWVVGTEATLL